MTKSEQINELVSALSKAQSQMKPALKTANNPFFNSKYADLNDVWEACRKPLTDNGLAIIQGPSSCEGNKIRLSTLLAHTSGQWIECVMETPVLKLDPQGIGSATSYLRRYSVAAMVGISTEDDDANEATQPQKRETYASNKNVKPAERSQVAPGNIRALPQEVKPTGKPSVPNEVAPKVEIKKETIKEKEAERLLVVPDTGRPGEETGGEDLEKIDVAELKAYVTKCWPMKKMANREVYSKLVSYVNEIERRGSKIDRRGMPEYIGGATQ